MGILLYGRPEMTKILKELPTDVLSHMKRVEVNVGVFTDLLYESSEVIDGLTRHRCKFFGPAAFYHDIGKVLIPKSVLAKPGKLTKEEWDLIRMHPIFAMRILSMLWEGVMPGLANRTFKYILDAAMYHHERWDGGGYPMGLRGYEIPLIARMTAICDAYDSMTNKRPYRKALTRDYACSEIEANAGTQFDPLLAKVFLTNEGRFAKSFYPELMLNNDI